MDRKDWTRIGLFAAICLVPGGFVLGGALAARRYRAQAEGTAAVEPADAAEGDTEKPVSGEPPPS